MGGRQTKGASAGRQGIGLYSYEQSKNTSPFQYFAQIVGGTIIAALGGVLVHDKISGAETNTWGWVGSLAIVVIGIFMAHAGLIFFFRRLSRLARHAFHGWRHSRKRRPRSERFE